MEAKSFSNIYFDISSKISEYDCYCKKIEDQLHVILLQHVYHVYTRRIIPELDFLKHRLMGFMHSQKKRLMRCYNASVRGGLTRHFSMFLGEDMARVIKSYYEPTWNDVERLLETENKLDYWLDEFSLNTYLKNNVHDYKIERS